MVPRRNGLRHSPSAARWLDTIVCRTLTYALLGALLASYLTVILWRLMDGPSRLRSKHRWDY